MSNISSLLKVSSGEPFLILEADRMDVAREIFGWQDSGLIVRSVRGSKMRTVERLFDEFASALQFPTYFGENWAAFDECLADMDWLPISQGIVLAFLQPLEVLADEKSADLDLLVRILNSAANGYAQAIESGEWWDRPAVPFHVVLVAHPGQAQATRVRWKKAGARIEENG